MQKWSGRDRKRFQSSVAMSARFGEGTLRMFFNRNLAVAAGAAALLLATPALAEWPDKPIKMIVAYAAGGSSDLPSRALTDAINQKFGTKIVVENRAGAAGVVGLDACAKAPADGYTFCTFTVSSMCILPNLRKTPFDIHEFTTVGRFLQLINAYSTRLDAPWKNMTEFIEAAKKNPGKLKVGSSGVGTTQHLSEVALMDEAKINLTHVPYGNSAEMITDTLGGRLDLIVESTAFPQYKAGKIRILAVSNPRPDFPELKTINDFVPGLDVRADFAVFAPKGTPPEIVKKFSDYMNQVVQTDALKARLLEIGGTAMTDNPDAMKKSLRQMCNNVDALVKKFNIKSE